ncbi:hypothetical protein GGF42_007168, partial [Coemansia sp. RSA 2424]
GSMVYEDACEMQRALEETMSRLTGDDYTTPIGTQSPLPSALSAALQQPPQPQQQPAMAVSAGFSAPAPTLDLTKTPANAATPDHSSHNRSLSPHSSLPPVFSRKLTLGDGVYDDEEDEDL